ncbi:glycosyltransferase [Saccharolobus islandicus]|uniref:Glycosyl transferase family 2 n=1 Tax=Saccharolobus islandicus (strain M.16.4 / Kamchatka \|nr:glycosyltransferase [Sulfolobus islandicus]ACR41262.1 glycosyl transferase family 2 [Sulfolobus islandicus M.16.4]
MLILLEIGALLVIIHLIEPIMYYLILKNKILKIQYSDSKFYSVSIIIPTYNEGERIKDKLINVIQSYPLDYMEIIIVDSSNDNTIEIIKSMQIPKLKIIKESQRRGKIFAIKEGIKSATNNIVVITDADATWKDPLLNAIAYLKDNIGAVSCIKYANSNIENSYRNFYNTIRIGESAIFSTPIFHGELTAFRKDILSPDDLPNVGADDSTIATLISLKGYRAICVDKMRAIEIAPKGVDYITWKTRRGSHLIRYFIRFLPKVVKSNNKPYKKIFLQEFYLHLLNPWLLFIGSVVIAISNIYLFTGLIIVSTILSLLNKNFKEALKAWIPNQIFLIFSQFFALRGEVLAWRKEKK